ncbi:DUF3016 domain-containing protein [Uliginosibacterium sp. H3]|uniref:DUF3016 domain-containing protein n=1 Tax=Uliginosibacterium silvisoli TaxID=3114758 RepID=A0ABU6K3F9_9RHOO|nr:DUF3016 domain-containing protein [Uliginosibacterium sp. H3]
MSLGAALGACLMLPVLAMAATQAPKVAVRFGPPAGLSENRDRSYVSKQQGAWLVQLGLYMQKTISPGLAGNERAEIEVRDLKFAGNVESWSGPAGSGPRVVRDTTPPRMHVVFRVVDENGQVLRSGERKLRDMNFMVSTGSPGDTLRYEKSLVDDWVDLDFPARP